MLTVALAPLPQSVTRDTAALRTLALPHAIHTNLRVLIVMDANAMLILIVLVVFALATCVSLTVPLHLLLLTLTRALAPRTPSASQDTATRAAVPILAHSKDKLPTPTDANALQPQIASLEYAQPMSAQLPAMD